MKMIRLSVRVLAALLLFTALDANLRATVSASAVLKVADGGNSSTYSISLQNNSTAGEAFTSFIFAGQTGQGYMAVAPTNVVAPNGWTAVILNSGGYAIRFVPLSAMAAGTSVSGFSFKSTSTLADFQGNSVFNSSVPVMTSQIVSNPLGTPNTNFLVAIQDPFDGSPIGGGYYFSAWFGIYDSQFYPWIYRTDLGFMYTDVSNTTDLYFYVENGNNGGSMGWIFTNQADWPNVYSFSRLSWLYFFIGGTSFYNYSTKAFETY